jgi:hypothetical protein
MRLPTCWDSERLQNVWGKSCKKIAGDGLLVPPQERGERGWGSVPSLSLSTLAGTKRGERNEQNAGLTFQTTANVPSNACCMFKARHFSAAPRPDADINGPLCFFFSGRKLIQQAKLENGFCPSPRHYGTY